MNNRRHKLVIFWWAKWYSETTLRLENATIEEATERAVEMGWEKPKWYKPWLYFRDYNVKAYD